MLNTIAWTTVAVAVAGTLISLVVLYFVIFLAVRHALRSHASWQADEAAFARRAGSGLIRDLER